MRTKWIVVTGGVLSGLGKGIAMASIGNLLSRNFNCVPVKCDGYLNVDPGTINPFEHGEIFVLDDGGEVDMDFGHYERFFSAPCKKEQNLTTGKIYSSVLKKEREGEFLGGTVQVIPHITNEIKTRFKNVAKESNAEVVLIEIGGTIGDIENSWFIEAVRQLRNEIGHEDFLSIHLTYVPFLSSTGEQKTKPAQRDVEALRRVGIIPDIIIARSEKFLSEKSKKKIALFCDVKEDAVISSPDVKSIYEIPFVFEQEGILKTLSKKFNFKMKEDTKRWKELINKEKIGKGLDIVVCGKYTGLSDAYASLTEALRHAAINLQAKINIRFVESSDVETGKIKIEKLSEADAIIVPIGFGERGVEGKIMAINYARTNDIPFLGLCYGMQLAVVEFCRNVCGLENAHTTEVSPDTKNPVVDILPEQKKVTEKGATMRLGEYTAKLKEGSKVQSLYKKDEIVERHRHRYEVNSKYHEILEEKGMIISGSSENGRIVEFIEIPGHKYFVATQSHPEYKSRLEKPSPLFYGLVKSALR